VGVAPAQLSLFYPDDPYLLNHDRVFNTGNDLLYSALPTLRPTGHQRVALMLVGGKRSGMYGLRTQRRKCKPSDPCGRFPLPGLASRQPDTNADH